MPRTSSTTRINPAALRDLRERSGFTFRDLAKRAGLNHSFIIQIESGKSAASPKTIRKLADAFAVDFDDLLLEDDE
jgi:transcriptional regulator with XRE-family HTH domain